MLANIVHYVIKSKYNLYGIKKDPVKSLLIVVFGVFILS